MVLLREWLLVKAAEQEEEAPAATADDMLSANEAMVYGERERCCYSLI